MARQEKHREEIRRQLGALGQNAMERWKERRTFAQGLDREKQADRFIQERILAEMNNDAEYRRQLNSRRLENQGAYDRTLVSDRGDTMRTMMQLADNHQERSAKADLMAKERVFGAGEKARDRLFEAEEAAKRRLFDLFTASESEPVLDEFGNKVGERTTRPYLQRALSGANKDEARFEFGSSAVPDYWQEPLRSLAMFPAVKSPDYGALFPTGKTAPQVDPRTGRMLGLDYRRLLQGNR